MAHLAPLSDLRSIPVTALLIISLVGCSGAGTSSDETLSDEPQSQEEAAPLAACSLLTTSEWESLVGPSDIAPEQTNSEATYVTPPVKTSL